MVICLLLKIFNPKAPEGHRVNILLLSCKRQIDKINSIDLDGNRPKN
jgi:hypothetical protein